MDIFYTILFNSIVLIGALILGPAYIWEEFNAKVDMDDMTRYQLKPFIKEQVRIVVILISFLYVFLQFMSWLSTLVYVS